MASDILTQALDRIYRINNEHDAIVEILLIAHSIDMIRYNRTVKRVELNNSLMNQKISKEKLRNLLEGVI